MLIEGSSNLQTQSLKARWLKNAPTVSKKCLFLKRMPRAGFVHLLDMLDIILDPFYFGSGNTFYESMAAGTPLITMPGRYMRGRIVGGGYKQMQLSDAPIAGSLDDYVDLCVKLENSPSLREEMKKEIRSKSSTYLYNDNQVGDEFLEFIITSIHAHKKGGRLSSGWKPSSIS